LRIFAPYTPTVPPFAQAATTFSFSVAFVAAKAEPLNVNKVNIKAVSTVQIDKRRNKINSPFFYNLLLHK
ncbi:hypothetical protein, partial [Kocuria palustris]|uniref:hypothetical protein n=1 Tax=Kocuria palustris TaxID=71999 RepID=UPI003CF6D125